MAKPQSGRFKIAVRFSELQTDGQMGCRLTGCKFEHRMAPHQSVREVEGAIFPLIIKIPNPIATRACGCLIFNGESKTNYDNSI